MKHVLLCFPCWREMDQWKQENKSRLLSDYDAAVKDEFIWIYRKSQSSIYIIIDQLLYGCMWRHNSHKHTPACTHTHTVDPWVRLKPPLKGSLQDAILWSHFWQAFLCRQTWGQLGRGVTWGRLSRANGLGLNFKVSHTDKGKQPENKRRPGTWLALLRGKS